ncbi:flavodoxin family protein [bacterium AH-315-E09]|nr:flavodoxin family protein [bacterium AH-315-G05]MBN4074387.1 flavodoxin family protein [bacterium AH-315-E09]
MKYLVIYSSETGNTKKVAEAIYEVMPEGTDLCDVGEVNAFDKYDFIAFGCWIDRGTADKKAVVAIENIKNKKVAVFATLGAYPDSQHAVDSMERIKKLFVDNENSIVGEFICQGKVDPRLTEKFKSLPPDHPHAMNEERIKRHKIAAMHPDDEDFANAQRKFKELFKK